MRWRDLARHTGASSTHIARILRIESKRWAKLVLGLDRGEDLLEQASRRFRVTACWLRGHVPELSDELSALISDHAGSDLPHAHKDAAEIAKTLAAWATCADCKTGKSKKPEPAEKPWKCAWRTCWYGCAPDKRKCEGK